MRYSSFCIFVMLCLSLEWDYNPRLRFFFLLAWFLSLRCQIVSIICV